MSYNLDDLRIIINRFSITFLLIINKMRRLTKKSIWSLKFVFVEGISSGKVSKFFLMGKIVSNFP